MANTHTFTFNILSRPGPIPFLTQGLHFKIPNLCGCPMVQHLCITLKHSSCALVYNYACTVHDNMTSVLSCFTGLHIQKGYTSLGTSTSSPNAYTLYQILLLSVQAHFNKNAYMHEQTTKGYGIHIGGGST